MAEIIGRVGWRNYVSPISPLWNNLVAYYTGDNTPNDEKGTYNGTLVNGTTYGTGKINNGFSLDGINDYVSLPSNTFTPSGSFSISSWVNLKAEPNVKFIFNSGGFVTNSICLYFNQSGLAFLVANASTYQFIQKSIAYNAGAFNVFHHIVCVKDAVNNKYLMYYDGVLFQEINITINPTFVDLTSRIGYNPGFSGSEFPGIIDEVGLWDGKALTAADVTELYNAGAGKQYVAPAEASIVSSGLIMNLDARNALSYSGTGTTWTDLSGNGNNGTLINGTSYSSANGGTLVFDGINDYVSVPGLTKTLIASNFAFSMWYNSTSTAATRGIFEISGGSGSSSPSILLQINGTTIRYLVNNGWRMTSSISTNTWYNMSLTYDGTTWKSYINGVLANSYVGGQYGGGSLYIGSGYGGVYNGNIPQFATYNRALSQAEITANFNALKSRYGL